MLQQITCQLQLHIYKAVKWNSHYNGIKHFRCRCSPFLELAFQSQLSSLHQGSSITSIKRWKWFNIPVTSGFHLRTGFITLHNPTPALMNSLNSCCQLLVYFQKCDREWTFMINEPGLNSFPPPSAVEGIKSVWCVCLFTQENTLAAKSWRFLHCTRNLLRSTVTMDLPWPFTDFLLRVHEKTVKIKTPEIPFFCSILSMMERLSMEIPGSWPIFYPIQRLLYFRIPDRTWSKAWKPSIFWFMEVANSAGCTIPTHVWFWFRFHLNS